MDTRRRFILARLAPEQAEPITVGAGDAAERVISLSTARLTHISGKIRGWQGRPLPAPSRLRSRAATGGWSMCGPQIGADGRFSIANVPPGDYSLEVVPMSGGLRPDGGRGV